MRIFFLGGTSYLGKEMIKRLEAHKNYEISVFVRNFESAKKLQGLKVRPVFAVDLSGLPEQDVVFNLVVDYGKNKTLAEVIAINVNFPLNVLEKIKFKTILNFSTALEKKLSHYSFSKKVLEETLSYLRLQKNWQVINLQLQHFFGPQAPEHNFVTFLIKKMLRNEELPLTDCQQKRDFIFTPDLLDAIEVILTNSKVLGLDESIELGSGVALRLQDFIETIKNISNSSSMLNFGAVPKRENEPFELVADTTKIKRLGWNPKTSVEEALKVTIGQLANE